MDVLLQQLVKRRAGGLCEYCRMLEAFDDLPFCFDHVIAQKHHGPTTESNLAWSCFSCNSHKGPNIAGLDPKTSQVVPLYHPRTMSWDEHFVWHGPELAGRSDIGEVTIDVLSINDPMRVELRRLLVEEGKFPPVP